MIFIIIELVALHNYNLAFSMAANLALKHFKDLLPARYSFTSLGGQA